MPNFPKNEHFLPPDTHTYICVSGGKKCSFFGKFSMLCFLETPVLRFALLPYYRRKVLLFIITASSKSFSKIYTYEFQLENGKLMIHSQNFANVANVNLLVDNILKQLVNQSSKVKLLRNIHTVLLL